MLDRKDSLWPYSKTVAIIVIPITWILFGIIFSITLRFASWPDSESRSLVITVSIIIGFIPLILVLLDFFSSRGAVLETPWGKIDFGRIDLNRAEVKSESFGLPDNIGITGPIISDTTPMNIIETLERATKNEIVVLNLKDGNAWWVTRLLALSAGAIRAESPNVFVFIGKRENNVNTFLGWGRPREILEAILNAKDEYQIRYRKSMQIAKQVAMYEKNELLPQGVILAQDVTRYTSIPDFTTLGDAVSEQILMDQLAVEMGYETGSLEKTPDRLTLSRLNDLFGHCLYQDAIDLYWPNEEQIAKLLNSHTPYLALVRSGKYESMLKRGEGERLILRELFLQFQQGVKS